jgi:DNA-binding MarR family transcriptional regulator
MAAERLSRRQRRILTWLAAEDQRTRGTMAADHQDLVRTLVALGFDKGTVSTSLTGLERQGLSRVHRSPGGKAESVDLIPVRQRISQWCIRPDRRQACRRSHDPPPSGATRSRPQRPWPAGS